MKKSYDVVIAGGSMVGATLAAALGDSRLQVAVIEPQPLEPITDQPDLRVSAITLASQTVFENLDVWDAMRRQRAAPVERMQIWDGQSVLNYDSADIGEPCLTWIVENRVMVNALVSRLRQYSNVELLNPAQLTAVDMDADRVRISLNTGSVLTARLLVGADGADSAVRKAAAIDWRRHDLDQSALVARIRTEHPHEHTAYQHFLPSGPLALLPLDDVHTVSMVWSADRPRARVLAALDDPAFNLELQQAFGSKLGRLQVASPRVSFPLALGFADTYTCERIALIGDAAHTVHPLAGQGVNLGILDAVTLAEVLQGAIGRDIGLHPLLRRYERVRKGADLGMQLVTGGFRYLFGSEWPPIRAFRRGGLSLTERLLPLKNAIMRQASGLTGELPKLARRTANRLQRRSDLRPRLE
jgi:2-octaprenylphenol hydroxylase